MGRPVSQGSGGSLAALDGRESLYLDLVRALAAFCVVLDHAPTLFDLPNMPRWGHQAVIVFFVLSGYVIAGVAATRETTGRRFVIARLARLWSVLVPAMALTIACDAVGRRFGINAAAYAMAPVDWPVIRVGAALTFLSETWVSIQPLSNGVAWSLCAEFWYYMLFAAWVFLPKGRTRLWVLAAAGLLSGPKALLLLPIWLTGAALHRLRARPALGVISGGALWIAGGAALGWVLAAKAYDPAIDVMRHAAGPFLFAQLGPARVFWLDWLLGLAIAAHLLGARTVAARLPLERVAPVIRGCAGVSFAAYLFHMPLLHLCAAFLRPDQGALAILLTLSAIALLGRPVERTKSWWKQGLTQLSARLRRRPRTPVTFAA